MPPQTLILKDGFFFLGGGNKKQEAKISMANKTGNATLGSTKW